MLPRATTRAGSAANLINRVRAHLKIRTLTRTELVYQEGHIGNFRSDLQTIHPDGAAEIFRIEHGLTIVATGGKEGNNHPWLTIPKVITQRQLEEFIIHNPREIAALRDIVMIQCVQPPGVQPYCSRVCCTNTLKNAIRLKLAHHECNITVLYKNIVTYGFREEYYNEARKLGVVFIRYTDEDPPTLEQYGSELRVRVRDLSLDRWLNLRADLVPMSMSIVPSEGNQRLADLLRVPISSEGFFEEAQMKLRPMDFMREGIFLAGMAHYPKFIEESISHALAAAARALSVISQGSSFYLGGVVAEVDPQKCVGCLTCTRTCPFEIPRVIQTTGRNGVGGIGGAAFIDPAQCQGCGTCTSECPANAIQLVNYRWNGTRSLLKGLHCASASSELTDSPVSTSTTPWSFRALSLVTRIRSGTNSAAPMTIDVGGSWPMLHDRVVLALVARLEQSE